MGFSLSFDVIVAGGGPGGSMAAKRCAERGLHTLLIEKKRLPRDKVCTGMVMGEWAHGLIRREFGEIPDVVLVDPPILAGHCFHVPRAEPRVLEWHTPLSWRKDLDYWLIQRAQEAGVLVEQGATVVRVMSENGVCRVRWRHRGVDEDLAARFVIGADGAASAVRRSMFPGLKIRYSAPIREWYPGSLDIQRDLVHWFFPRARARPRFNVNHKNDGFLIEGRALRVLRPEIEQTLARYGFDRRAKPGWKDACAIASLHEDLLSGEFSPADGNILLVGDAAGLLLPITFEGIGSALKSGLVAAESVVESASTGRPAASSYLEGIEPIRETIRLLSRVQSELDAASHRNPQGLVSSLLEAYRETLVLQER